MDVLCTSTNTGEFFTVMAGVSRKSLGRYAHTRVWARLPVVYNNWYRFLQAVCPACNLINSICCCSVVWPPSCNKPQYSVQPQFSSRPTVYTANLKHADITLSNDPVIREWQISLSHCIQLMKNVHWSLCNELQSTEAEWPESCL